MAKKKTLSIVAVRGAVHLGGGAKVRSDPVDVPADQAQDFIDAGVCRLADPVDDVQALDDQDDNDASGPDVTGTD